MNKIHAGAFTALIFTAALASPALAGPADATAPVGTGISSDKGSFEQHSNYKRHMRRMRKHVGGISRGQNAAKIKTDTNEN